MEQMESSLCSFIRRLTDGGSKLSLFQALDVILQIAYGMCYVHEHGIAHRDLKTSNVVVRRINVLQLEGYLEVKIVDFGISKGKLSQHKSNTITRPKIGTTLYMPPEAFSNGRANWFKADVYSFSVMCSVILSGKEPFQNIKRGDLHEAICRGVRPELPTNTPEELASLIMEGWATDRDSRPSFVDIFTRLEVLRHHLLRKHSTGWSGKQVDPVYSSGYIQEMLQKRSKAREQEYLYSGLQSVAKLLNEEEWFDGEELLGSQHLGNSSQKVVLQPSGNSNQVTTPADRNPKDFDVLDPLNLSLSNSQEDNDPFGLGSSTLELEDERRVDFPLEYSVLDKEELIEFNDILDAEDYDNFESKIPEGADLSRLLRSTSDSSIMTDSSAFSKDLWEELACHMTISDTKFGSDISNESILTANNMSNVDRYGVPIQDLDLEDTGNSNKQSSLPEMEMLETSSLMQKKQSRTTLLP